MTFHGVQQFSQRDGLSKNVLNAQAIRDSGFGGETLLERFNSQFDAVPANTAERIRTAQRIRYQVYCIEHPHERADNADGLETDEFDSHAAQSLLICRAANAALGTVRLILPLANDVEFSFPVRRVLDRDSVAVFKQLPLHATAEVSRFSISREFRRMARSSETIDGTGFFSNSAVPMRLGLIQSLVRMSTEHGITHWCAAMEPTLLRMLSAMAIRFRPIGPLIEYHGLRQPCYCVVDDMLNEVRRERPAFWSVLTDEGTLLD